MGDMDAFLAMTLALCGLALVRNELVYRHRMRRTSDIHEENQAAINRGTTDAEFDALLRKYDEGPSHESMMFDLRKWTYRQFYPEQPAARHGGVVR